MVCPPFCHQELQAHHPEFDGKLRTTSIGDIYEAVRASQETGVCNEMRETHPCQPFTGARSLVLTCARPFDLLLGIEASCNTTVMLEGGVMAKQNKKQERLKGAPTRENSQEFDGKIQRNVAKNVQYFIWPHIFLVILSKVPAITALHQVLVNSVDHLSGASFKLPHLQSYAPQALASDSLPPLKPRPQPSFFTHVFPLKSCPTQIPTCFKSTRFKLLSSCLQPCMVPPSLGVSSLSGDMLHALEECAWSSSLWLLVLGILAYPSGLRGKASVDMWFGFQGLPITSVPALGTFGFSNANLQDPPQ
ncbi:hypothetical protein B0H14DRAFT_2645467 [Mycena olivaceomarginata]|nr:hypothetical protein B0H14DRAFT_2645467 [Mycena olivaceomarginata]